MAKYSSISGRLCLEYLSGMAYNSIQTVYKRLGLSDTYSEELNVVQDLVVEGEVIAGNDIDSGLFLYLPVLQAQSFALAQQVVE